MISRASTSGTSNNLAPLGEIPASGVPEAAQSNSTLDAAGSSISNLASALIPVAQLVRAVTQSLSANRMEDDLSTKVEKWIQIVTEGLPQTEAQRLCTSGYLKSGWGHVKEATIDFEKVMALYPSPFDCPKDVGNAFNGRGDIHLRAGRFEEAMNDYAKAIELFWCADDCDQALARALYTRGQIFRFIGFYDEAEAAFREVIEIRNEEFDRQEQLPNTRRHPISNMQHGEVLDGAICGLAHTYAALGKFEKAYHNLELVCSNVANRVAEMPPDADSGMMRFYGGNPMEGIGHTSIIEVRMEANRALLDRCRSSMIAAKAASATSNSMTISDTESVMSQSESSIQNVEMKVKEE